MRESKWVFIYFVLLFWFKKFVLVQHCFLFTSYLHQMVSCLHAGMALLSADQVLFKLLCVGSSVEVYNVFVLFQY